MTDLLVAAQQSEPDVVFEHADSHYRRIAWKNDAGTPRQRGNPPVTVTNLTTGVTINVTRDEDKAFSAWAVIETLRLTGVRLEELLEITHLALVSYKLADTGGVVPLLQIVPSKTNEERLLLVSPELASVLATIITRLRTQSITGSVPLVARYDPRERVTGPPLPHLFQHPFGTRRQVVSPTTVYSLLNTVLAAADLRDAAGQPLHYKPHDFRRMFATEAVTGGLPAHIAARLLGHATIATTQTYLAVFQDDLIRSYRVFIDNRRAVRPSEEYREPTDQEWHEFQQHFELRKVSLGDCGRPYASPCQHEHACVRCPMLRVSPRQRPRLVEIIHNLNARITEAKTNGWLGEAQGLQVSMDAATKKLVALDRSAQRMGTARHLEPTDLGMPTLPMLSPDNNVRHS